MKSPMSGSRLAAYILLSDWLVEFAGLLLLTFSRGAVGLRDLWKQSSSISVDLEH